MADVTFSLDGRLPDGAAVSAFRRDAMAPLDLTAGAEASATVVNQGVTFTGLAWGAQYVCIGRDANGFPRRTVFFTPPQFGAGIVGPQGPPGATGLAGVQGITGRDGVVGPSGIDGAPGVAGPVGSVGPPGAAGAQGVQGMAGQTGSLGPKGDTGIQGIVGATGPAGAPGASAVIYAAKASTDANGSVTFTFPGALFSAAPVVSHSLEGATTTALTAQITALSKTAVTLKVFKSTLSPTLSLGLNALITPAASVVVHVEAANQT